MGRAYSMYVTVFWKPEPGENISETADRISAAMREEWGFDLDPFNLRQDKEDGTVRLSATAEGNLCGGEAEDEFADRLDRAVWEVAAGVKIEVNATCLEYIPSTLYTFNEQEPQGVKQQ